MQQISTTVSMQKDKAAVQQNISAAGAAHKSKAAGVTRLKWQQGQHDRGGAGRQQGQRGRGSSSSGSSSSGSSSSSSSTATSSAQTKVVGMMHRSMVAGAMHRSKTGSNRAATSFCE